MFCKNQYIMMDEFFLIIGNFNLEENLLNIGKIKGVGYFFILSL